MVDKLNSDQTQVDLNETRNKVNEIIDALNRQIIIPWSPSEIPTLGWWDASDTSTIQHTSNSVTQWNDKSGNSNHVVANGDPSTGSSTQNLLNVIDFDGNDHFRKQNFANPSSGDLVVFIVCEVTGVDSVFDSIIAQDAADKDWQLDANDSAKFYGLLRNTNLGTTSAGNAEITGFNIFCVSFDKTEDQKFELLVNGSLLSGTTSVSYTSNVASTVNLMIFANRALNHSPSGKVAEVIIYESPSNSQRQQVEGYLAHKWGLEGSLDNAHPYKDWNTFLRSSWGYNRL